MKPHHQFVGGTSDAHPERCDRCDVDFSEHWKPIAIDLFCGKGGWTNALLEKGFTVYGFDIEPQPEYKGTFVQCDILTLTADDLRTYGAIFATCSSPCEQFSVHGMKHFHPNPPFPAMGIKLFNHARALLEELGIPYVMENVRPAKNFVGRETNHCGPFYLWGPGVPAIFPPCAYKIQKGLMTKWIDSKGKTRTQGPQGRAGRLPGEGTVAASRERTAQAAMIPLSIARAVADVAERYIP